MATRKKSTVASKGKIKKSPVRKRRSPSGTADVEIRGTVPSVAIVSTQVGPGQWSNVVTATVAWNPNDEQHSFVSGYPKAFLYDNNGGELKNAGMVRTNAGFGNETWKKEGLDFRTSVKPAKAKVIAGFYYLREAEASP
jgi:hypothetical protein